MIQENREGKSGEQNEKRPGRKEGQGQNNRYHAKKVAEENKY
jgi:hypothetical protein